MKSIKVEESVWKKLNVLKLKKGFSTINKTIQSILDVIKQHKMEDELE